MRGRQDAVALMVAFCAGVRIRLTVEEAARNDPSPLSALYSIACLGCLNRFIFGKFGIPGQFGLEQ
jgi:hypothetical protein